MSNFYIGNANIPTMSNFYDGLKVVVTGGAGMVGSVLVQMLVERGANVLVQDDFSHGKTYIKGAQYVTSDAGNERACMAALKDADCLFNLAAYVAGVQFNQHNHALMYERNARLQTVPILAAAAQSVPYVLQTSSVCIYSPDANTPSVETRIGDEPHAANSGYAWAKRMGERVAQWAGLPHVVIVRPSNIYGPRDYFDDRAHVIPALIKKMMSGDTIIVNGSGEERREFIYVDDVARGMLVALSRGEGVYNIGTGGDTCVSIHELVLMIGKIVGTNKPYQFSQDYDSGDPARYSDVSKLHALGWRHRVGLEAGLANTITWYRERL